MFEKLINILIPFVHRDVLSEYHLAIVPFCEQLDQLEVCLPLAITTNTITGGIPKFKVEFK